MQEPNQPFVKSMDSARQFLDYLSPIANRWTNQPYIFRGQADSLWQLTPSAFRNSGRLSVKGLFGLATPTASEQIHFEVSVLMRFLEACDTSGLVVPGYGADMKHELGHLLLLDQFREWPIRRYDEPLAVAQHYGAPTRLIDWSRRSYVAAYFAASSALQMPEPPGLVAVWALNISVEKSWSNLGLVNLPGGTAPNMAAQSGLFTIHRGKRNTPAVISGLELEPELYEYLNDGDQPALYKVTLPYSECRELMRLCEKFGVSAPVLFPGMEGARKYVVDWAHTEYEG